MTLIVGIPACSRDINATPQHAAPSRYGAAVLGGAGAIPVLLPPEGSAMLAVLDRLDGLLLSGSPSNVDPLLYGVEHDATPGRHDAPRDATTLPLIRAALARGLPVLAICRGLQELNVALGGSLHQQVQDLPGRQDHRGGPGTMEHRYRPKHAVRLEGGIARMLGRTEVQVNSLHEQALDRVAPGLVVEGWAPDGTIEAVRVDLSAGWAYGVQWHPEWQFADNADSVAIFAAFGAACRAYAARAIVSAQAA
jgi:putative glutamine amidotransferase